MKDHKYVDINNLSDDFFEEIVEGNRAKGTPMTDKEILYSLINHLWSMPDLNLVEVPATGMGDMSDGYHTFNELYHHRAILFAVVCSQFPSLAWKSKNHHDSDDKMYGGMFIVGIDTPAGQATYHYDIDPYWDYFKVKELDRAPAYDGHTPSEAIARIRTLNFFSKSEGMDQEYSICGETAEEVASDLLEIADVSKLDKHSACRLTSYEYKKIRNAAFLILKMNDDIYHHKRLHRSSTRRISVK